MERAELLCDLKNHNKRVWWYLPGISFIVAAVAPMIGVLPFTVALEEGGADPSRDRAGLLTSSAFVGCLCSVYSILLLHVTNLAFARVPLGVNTPLTILVVGVLCFLMSSFFRQIFSSIFPLEQVVVGLLSFILADVLFGMIKFVPVRNQVTGKTKNYSIGAFAFSLSSTLISYSK